MHEHELKILEAGNSTNQDRGVDRTELNNTGKHRVGREDLNIGNIHDSIIGGNILGGSSSSESMERAKKSYNQPGNFHSEFHDASPGKTLFASESQKQQIPRNSVTFFDPF
jgi:hypothetical protein